MLGSLAASASVFGTLDLGMFPLQIQPPGCEMPKPNGEPPGTCSCRQPSCSPSEAGATAGPSTPSTSQVSDRALLEANPPPPDTQPILDQRQIAQVSPSYIPDSQDCEPNP